MIDTFLSAGNDKAIMAMPKMANNFPFLITSCSYNDLMGAFNTFQIRAFIAIRDKKSRNRTKITSGSTMMMAVENKT